MNWDSKKFEPGKLIGLAFVLLLAAPQVVVPIAVIWGVIKLVKVASTQTVNTSAASRPARPVARREKFDDCPRPLFCFHKDKGEHHVRKGREIDPWDRPDIDISKYQRRR